MSIYEINMANARADVDTMRVKKNSPVVEVFSALVAGNQPNVSDAVKDKAVATLKELSAKALAGDPVAMSEINSIIRFSIEPKLLETVKLFSFMGSYKRIGYHEAPMMKTYKYESVDSRFQASSSDVPFAAMSWREYPIATQTISAGFAVDYRELQSGNFDGSIAEGMNQVQIDMQNKAVYYVTSVLYNALKNAKGVKHFAESAGITKTGVDAMLKSMRRYGKVNIAGDYSVVSQFNDFSGYKTVGDNTISFGSDVVAEEIRKTGLVSFYNGAFVTELPNAINWTKLNKDGTDYDLYLPQGLLFMLPQGAVSPLQIFLRGGMTTMTGDDIVTRQHMTRFDMELGAGVAEGMEDQIGLISDTNYELPASI
jgi:hypothetical protein